MSDRFTCARQLAIPRNRRIWTAAMDNVATAPGMRGAFDSGRPAIHVLRGQPAHPSDSSHLVRDGHHFRFVADDRPTPPHPAITAKPDATWNLRLLAASLLALGQSLILSDGHGCYCFLLVFPQQKVSIRAIFAKLITQFLVPYFCFLLIPLSLVTGKIIDNEC